LHAPWLERVRGQLLAACAALEDEYALRQVVPTSATIDQATITTAVAWHFVQQVAPQVVTAADYPSLVALSAAAERLPEFSAAPYGDTTFVWPA